jgi:hypothetical protein
MGEMAGMALDRCMIEEDMLDEYCNSTMGLSEAYENGFIDEMGVETQGVQSGWDRTIIGGIDTINNELLHAEKDFQIFMYQGEAIEVANDKVIILNGEAVANLSKEYPTCNCCRVTMKVQSGRFGKFYFCGNKCEGQSTVSDKYWQGVRQ